MEALTVLILLILFISTSYEEEKHCILFANACVTHCPRNMHAYHTRCDEDAQSQPTCDEPYVYSLGYTCGWSRCDCNGELLLDERTYSCVDLYTCQNSYKRQGRYRPRKRPKIRLPDMDE